MIAYGTQKLSESFRNVCRSKDIPYEDYNEVAKSIDSTQPDDKWLPLVEEAKQYIGVITSVSPHPCAHLILNKDIEEEIGVVRVGDEICCLITSSEADEYKYLKNDYLKVVVWEIIAKTFKEINQPILTVEELCVKTDQKIWDLLSDGYTATLNQVDGDWATQMLMQFKPQSLEELSMFVGAIRPSFESFREQFLQRKPYSTGSKDLDNLFSCTHHYIIFQENLMQYFEWLGVSPAESIGLIKKISKKKIKPDDFLSLEQRLETNWELKTGSKKGFRETWDKMQAMMGYGFNCVSGKTKIMRNKNGKFEPTVEEMYNIMNDYGYAKKTNHKNLRTKYLKNGYGKAFSLCEDNRIRENSIVNISYAGVRQTYRLTTKSGYEIVCTDNHKFPTPKGKIMLKDLCVGDKLYIVGKYQKKHINYNLTTGKEEKNYPKKGQQGFQTMAISNKKIFNSQRESHIKNKDSCEICHLPYNDLYRFELHHKDFCRTNNNIDNYQWLCASCHKKIHYQNNRTKKYENGIVAYLDPIISIEPESIENVYDISMAEPYHNFVVNDGLVTSNSPHGVATALDCMYGAYLKANFPLEYYTTVLNIYKDNQNKISAIEKELPHFHINILPIKFGRSQSDYSYDKQTNDIYKGVSSIKYVNEKAATALYEFSKKTTPNQTFPDILFAIKREKIDVDARMLKALICLDYFSAYGKNKKLLTLFNVFIADKLYEKKNISKTKKLVFTTEMLQQSCSKETAKLYKFDDMSKLFNLYFDSLPDTSLDTQQQIVCEIEYLKKPISTYDCNLSNYIIIDYEINYGTPRATLYNLNTGEIVETKIDKKISFSSNKQLLFNKYSIISVPEISQKNRYKKNPDGTFTKLDSLENIVKHFVLVKKWEDTDLIEIN